MSKYRIICPKCDFKTAPSFYESDCIKEKERAHIFGIIKPPDKSAHDAAFSNYCPKCGGKIIIERKWFD